MQFDIKHITDHAHHATNELLTRAKAHGLDQDFVAEFGPGLEFKVFISPTQVNMAIICPELSTWLKTFFTSSEEGEEMNEFEKDFFGCVYDFAVDKELFTIVDHIETRMWINSDETSHSPDAIFFAYADVETDYQNTNWEELELVLRSGYGVMIMAHMWLTNRHKALQVESPAVC